MRASTGKYTNETGTNTIPLPVQTEGSMGTDVWGASCSGKYTNETGTNTIPLPVQTGGSMGTDVWGPAVLVSTPMRQVPILGAAWELVSTPMRQVPIQYHYLYRLGAAWELTCGGQLYW